MNSLSELNDVDETFAIAEASISTNRDNVRLWETNHPKFIVTSETDDEFKARDGPSYSLKRKVLEIADGKMRYITTKDLVVKTEITILIDT
jgi:hypothetical protein